MGEQSNVVHTELYAFEIDGMTLSGAVTDRGDGRCTVRGTFEDVSDAERLRFEFRTVPRQAFADLVRSFADNVAPVHGGTYGFMCELHVAELEGQPAFRRDENAGTWSLGLDGMECSHADENQSCRPSWHMDFVALGGDIQ
ncbi:hypothetical protein [Amycolatopsis sp. CA-126428]|uniref:hypothetical protein n=1 Tax=Amycolatopsis sp. CA-126428 TaxID=2073158 RepID=UPI000CD0E8E0|nr:hypothetical protein [Amycolatopsis sp. CA-126428]